MSPLPSDERRIAREQATAIDAFRRERERAIARADLAEVTAVQLRNALVVIEPEKLRFIATYLDLVDAVLSKVTSPDTETAQYIERLHSVATGDSAQNDVRAWANRIEALLASDAVQALPETEEG